MIACMDTIYVTRYMSHGLFPKFVMGLEIVIP